MSRDGQAAHADGVKQTQAGLAEFIIKRAAENRSVRIDPGNRFAYAPATSCSRIVRHLPLKKMALWKQVASARSDLYWGRLLVDCPLFLINFIAND